jgi:hypothetical protein
MTDNQALTSRVAAPAAPVARDGLPGDDRSRPGRGGALRYHHDDHGLTTWAR